MHDFANVFLADGPWGDRPFAAFDRHRPSGRPLAATHLIKCLRDHLYRDDVARQARFDHAVEAGELAFWAAIVDRYPEVTSGDFAPEQVRALVEALEVALRGWLNWNGRGSLPTDARWGADPTNPWDEEE